MAKTNYVNGEDLPASWVMLMQYFVFDDTDFDGHYPRLVDDALSNAPGNIKSDFRQFINGLKVTADVGLSVAYQGGTIRIPNGDTVVIPPGTVNIPATTTVTVYVNVSGGVVFALPNLLPVTRFDLATVTTTATIVSAVTDLRVFNTVLPDAEALKTFGGSGSEGDLVINNTRTFDDGEYWFRNLTIGETGVLNISSAVRIYCSNDFVCNGLINVTPPIQGGAALGGASASTIFFNDGNGAGGGSAFTASPAYNYVLSPVGSGGSTGICLGTNFNAGFGKGGNGGGSIYVEAGGNVTVSSTANINARGGNAGVGSVVSQGGLQVLSGSGGGSGGSNIFKALKQILIQGTIDVRGGNGSNGIFAVDTSNAACGGAAGGGGLVALIAPVINTNLATIRLDPGVRGTTINPAAAFPTAGGAGGSFAGQGGNGNQTTVNDATAGRLMVRTLIASV